jgi:hypothetical protein
MIMRKFDASSSTDFAAAACRIVSALSCISDNRKVLIGLSCQDEIMKILAKYESSFKTALAARRARWKI